MTECQRFYTLPPNFILGRTQFTQLQVSEVRRHSGRNASDRAIHGAIAESAESDRLIF